MGSHDDAMSTTQHHSGTFPNPTLYFLWPDLEDKNPRRPGIIYTYTDRTVVSLAQAPRGQVGRWHGKHIGVSFLMQSVKGKLEGPLEGLHGSQSTEPLYFSFVSSSQLVIRYPKIITPLVMGEVDDIGSLFR